MQTKNNSVIDITDRLIEDSRVRQEYDGVMFSKCFDIDRSSDSVNTHIEVYSRGFEDEIGLNLTIGDTSTLLMMTTKEADELAKALLASIIC